PGEQHQQKMPESTDDDNEDLQLPSKKAHEKSADPEIEGDDAALPSKADASATSEPATGGAIASFFDFDDNELDEQSEQLPTLEGKPQHTEALPQEEEEQGAIDWDDDSFLPSVASTETSGEALPSAFAFPEIESATTEPPAGDVAEADSGASDFSLD